MTIGRSYSLQGTAENGVDYEALRVRDNSRRRAAVPVRIGHGRTIYGKVRDRFCVMPPTRVLRTACHLYRIGRPGVTWRAIAMNFRCGCRQSGMHAFACNISTSVPADQVSTIV